MWLGHGFFGVEEPDAGGLATPVLTFTAGTYFNGESPAWSATSSDGDLDRIDLVLDPGGGESVVDTDATSPYSGTWLIGITPGAHTLVARAVRGAETQDSTPVAVTIVDAELQIDTLIADGNWTSPAAPFLHPDGTRSAARIVGQAPGGGGVGNQGAGQGGDYGESKVTGLSASTAYAVAGLAGGAENNAAPDLTFDTDVMVVAGGPVFNGSRATTVADIVRLGGAGGTGASNQTGGGAGGDASAASGTTAGESTGGWSSLAGPGRAPGGGGGSSASAGSAGANGWFHAFTLVPADQTEPFLTGVAGGRDTSDLTSRAAVQPTGIVAGELLLLLVGCDGVPTIGEDSGSWTGTTQQNESTSQCSFRMFWKVAEGGGDDQTNITTSAGQQVTQRCYRIANAGTPVIQTGQGNAANADPPSATLVGSAKAIAIAGGVWDMGNVNVAGIPSGYSGLLDRCSANNGGVRMASCHRKFEGTTEDPGAFTIGSEQFCTFTILVPVS